MVRNTSNSYVQYIFLISNIFLNPCFLTQKSLKIVYSFYSLFLSINNVLCEYCRKIFLHCKDIINSTFGNFNMICDVFSASLPSRCAFHSEMVNNIFHLYLRVIPLSITKCQISHLANLSYNAAS